MRRSWPLMLLRVLWQMGSLRTICACSCSLITLSMAACRTSSSSASVVISNSTSRLRKISRKRLAMALRPSMPSSSCLPFVILLRAIGFTARKCVLSCSMIPVYRANQPPDYHCAQIKRFTGFARKALARAGLPPTTDLVRRRRADRDRRLSRSHKLHISGKPYFPKCGVESAKGGGAWGQGNSNGTGVLANGTPFQTTWSNTDRSGWVVGAGVEWGFAPNWSAKLEYDHIDFGSTNVTINTSVGTSSITSSSETIDMVKAGVNYRFNWGGPAVARY